MPTNKIRVAAFYQAATKTKQELIQEGITIIASSCPRSTLPIAILEYLNRNDVVIKVKGELPEYWRGDWFHDDNGNKHTLEGDMIDAGFTATKPLIAPETSR